MVLGLFGLLLLQNHVSRAQNSNGGAVAVSAEDRKFLLDAAQSGLHEVKMGMLGVQRGTNNALKVYAQRILDDHSYRMPRSKRLQALCAGVAFPRSDKHRQFRKDRRASNRHRVRPGVCSEAIEDHLKHCRIREGRSVDDVRLRYQGFPRTAPFPRCMPLSGQSIETLGHCVSQKQPAHFHFDGAARRFTLDKIKVDC